MDVRIRTARLFLAAAALAGAAAGGQDLYWGGGAGDVGDNTALPVTTNGLTGLWNATLKNWATAPSPGVYTSYTGGAHVHLGYYTNSGPGLSAVLTLETSPEVTGLSACMNMTTDYNRFFDLTAASAQTLTPSGLAAVLNPVSQDATRGLRLRPNVALAGSAPVEKSGMGVFEIQSDSSAYSGGLRVSMGTLVLANTGSLKGVPRFDLFGKVVSATAGGYGGNEFGMGTLTHAPAAGANDRLGDNALFVINRGALDYRTGSASTETIGRVDLETWGVLGGGQGAGGGTLTLSDATAGLTRGSTGLGMAMVPLNAAGTPFVNIRVPNGLATDTLLPWLASGRAGFMMVDSANNNTLVQVPSTEAAADVSTWTSLYGATHNLRIGNNTSVTLTGTLGDDLTVNAIGFFNTAATTLTLGNGKTLTLASGGLSYRSGGSSAHQTLTNGFLTSGTDKLYLNSSDSGSSGTLYIHSGITGALDVIKAGISSVDFRGVAANTYSGATIVNSGHLALNKTGGAIAIPGPLVVRHSGSVASGGNQINPVADVTIEAGGLIYTFAQSFGGVLKLAGGTLLFPNVAITVTNSAAAGLVFNGGWLNQNSSHPGTLNLQTDVRYESNAVSQARFERLYTVSTGSYHIELDGGNRTFDIADSTTLASDVPEMVIDTPLVPGSPAGGRITKAGTGTLQLTTTNSFAGGTTVNGGTLRVSSISAAAQSNLTAFTSASGGGSSMVTFNAPVAKEMAVGQSITGTTFRAVTVVRVLNDYEILTSSFNNLGVSTNVSVSAIARSGNLGTGPVVVNSTGTLKLDAGIAVTNAVTVTAGGTLAASGAGVGSLTIDEGTLAAELAAGPVTVNSAASLTGAALQVTGQVGTAPTVILTANGGVTGTFAQVPRMVAVVYTPNSVAVRKITGSVVMLR